MGQHLQPGHHVHDVPVRLIDTRRPAGYSPKRAPVTTARGNSRRRFHEHHQTSARATCHRRDRCDHRPRCSRSGGIGESAGRVRRRTSCCTTPALRLPASRRPSPPPAARSSPTIPRSASSSPDPRAFTFEAKIEASQRVQAAPTTGLGVHVGFDEEDLVAAADVPARTATANRSPTCSGTWSRSTPSLRTRSQAAATT